MIFAQVVFGLAIGAAAASLGILLLKKGTTQAAGMDMILVIALVMIAFGLSEAIGGNAFLTVYLMGILLGNSNIRGKERDPVFDRNDRSGSDCSVLLAGAFVLPAQAAADFLCIPGDCHRTDGDHPSGYGISDYEAF